jgi:hypothetical protein
VERGGGRDGKRERGEGVRGEGGSERERNGRE